MNKKKYSAACIFFIFFLLAAGSWGAKKTSGFDWQSTYTGDTWHSITGNLNEHGHGSYLGLFDLKLNFDLDQLLKFKQTDAVIELQNLHGQRPNLFVNSLQGFDNIEDDRRSTNTYLYKLWVQHRIGTKWSLLAGFNDINADFYITPSSQYLILSTFSLGTDLNVTGLNGPSTYPLTGASLRLKFTPSKEVYVEGAIFDASAANPTNRIYPYFPFSRGQGILSIIEAGHLFWNKNTNTGKIGLGAWRYSQQPPPHFDPRGLHIIGQSADRGVYVLADYPLYRKKTKVVHGFLRYGLASFAMNFYDHALGAGLTFNGFIPQRPDDLISYGLGPAWSRNHEMPNIQGFPQQEWQNELTYLAVINKWLSLQPDLQYISFIAADGPEFKNSWLVGLRFILTAE